MRLVHLLLLLLAAFITAANAIPEDQAPALRRLETPENGKQTPENAGETNALVDEEVDEERISKFLAKLNFLGRNKAATNPGVTKTLGDVRSNPDVAKALADPSVQKFGVMVNKPGFLTKLFRKRGAIKAVENDPGIARAISSVEKANVKIAKSDVQQVMKDPSKASKLVRLKGFLDAHRKPISWGLSVLMVLAIFAGMVYAHVIYPSKLEGS